MRALLPLLVLLPGLAQADTFIPCEQRGAMELSEAGGHVHAWFLGRCDQDVRYDEVLAVQVELAPGWHTVGMDWHATGTEQVDVGGELVSYSVYEQQVSCPDPGTFSFRVAWVDDGEETWFSDQLTEQAGYRDGCSSAPGPGSALVALLVGLLATLPRRRGSATTAP